MRKQPLSRRLQGRVGVFLFALSLLFPDSSVALRPLSPPDNAGLEEELKGRLRPAAGAEEVPSLKDREDIPGIVQGELTLVKDAVVKTTRAPICVVCAAYSPGRERGAGVLAHFDFGNARIALSYQIIVKLLQGSKVDFSEVVIELFGSTNPLTDETLNEMLPSFEAVFAQAGIPLRQGQIKVHRREGGWDVALDTRVGKAFRLVDVLPRSKEAADRLAAYISAVYDSVAAQHLRFHDIADAGLEEGIERMPAREFGRRYGELLLAAQEEKGQLESWLKRADVLATVLDLPVQLPLYVKGDRLFWRIVDDLLPRAGADPRLKKIHLAPVLLPTSQWSDLGLILRDPLFDLSDSDNPKGLRVRVVEPEAVPELSFTDLLLDIFQSRLGVPESERLGAFVFTDPAGQAHLVLFHSA